MVIPKVMAGRMRRWMLWNKLFYYLVPQGVILFLPWLEVISGASLCLPDVGRRNCGGNMPRWQCPDRLVTSPDPLLGSVFAEVPTQHHRVGWWVPLHLKPVQRTSAPGQKHCPWPVWGESWPTPRALRWWGSNLGLRGFHLPTSILICNCNPTTRFLGGWKSILHMF